LREELHAFLIMISGGSYWPNFGTFIGRTYAWTANCLITVLKAEIRAAPAHRRKVDADAESSSARRRRFLGALPRIYRAVYIYYS